MLKDQMIRWWIGESFIPLRSGRLSTEVGEDCFSQLSNRCLIEVVDKAYNGVIHTCKMHDMVRDLVIKIAKDDAFFTPSDANCRHFVIDSEMNGKKLLSNKKLRALITTTKSGEVNNIRSNIVTKFSECRHLQVLDLSKSIFDVPLSSLLDDIGSAKQLAYLSFSNTHPLAKVPSSIAKLEKLQILDFSYCQNLKMLPSCILILQNLVVLDVSNCGSLEYLPQGLKRLTYLQVLLGFKPAKSSQSGGCRIAELRSLTRLRTLSLRLTRDEEIGDDDANALVDLHELQFLTISCFDCQDAGLATKLCTLYPPRQLHELTLKFYPGETSPHWLNPISLPMLRYLSIISGDLTKMHESFWGDGGTVWRTEGLMLEALSYLEEEWSAMHQVMPSLGILKVSWCPELVSFPIEDAGFRGGIWKKEEHRS